MSKPLKGVVLDDDKTIAIGDPVAVTSGKPAARGWQVTYHGQARTHEIGGCRWAQGETKELLDMAIVLRARNTCHFQVMPPRVVVDRGRVFKIYRIDKARHFLDSSFIMDTCDLDNLPMTHEFVIVTPSGALHSFKDRELRQSTEAEVVELARAEQEELMNGRIPYRGHLKLIGRGRWGRGKEL